ncbi:hypothetical protein B0J13DRAFT_4141 [Dactylonectria estremocensis]|uniref:DUF8004 domain-containing protein n=1 Tax=Dactylonectria estremocensis TaxID=1079267 RepID=A0A9P9FIQ6_9HYPO|nr:hypothetical protein B0J13DRAFT_4141 [Dactylonectria estremocensis]
MTISRRSPRMRRYGDFIDSRAAPGPLIKRWDGAARTCSNWDSLRRDPELWFRNGNCLIYLYGKGESRRGPSFKVPFAALLEAKCYPLIGRFIAWELDQSPDAHQLEEWSRKNPSTRVDLYIPAPPTMDKMQAFSYHVATRNFLAWALRRSMVGKSLGNAIVALLHSMHEFRSDVEDNVADMMYYFDEEGYLSMANQPNHALAMLYLAEMFQMGELYTRAFAHCVGMREYLLESTEYQFISPESRKLIRRARTELDTRLIQSSRMLKTFLDDELSEAHLSVSEGARAHLERFRSFLLSFYTTKLGYYPPFAADPAYDVFDPSIYRTMREDFEALYDLLVDDQYTSSQTMPTHGGICTIQLVHSFDMGHDYTTLEHPLPLIPQLSESSRRMAWLPGRDRLRSDRRTTAHAALIKASNIMKPGVAQNDLVRSYRRFEEESITSPNKADKQEKVSLVDARKVRWILVYAIYQVLRSATDMAAEVEQDVDEANYSLSVSMANTPPWKKTREMERILRRQTELFTSAPDFIFQDDSILPELDEKIEIKPDVDYFALTHKEPLKDIRDYVKVLPERRASLPSRSNSLSRALGRSSTIRRSMRMFKTAPNTPPQTATPQSRQTYHEIVVLGYGNGTNDVNMDINGSYLNTTTWPNRSDSTTSTTASKTDDSGGLTPESMGSTDDTWDSVVTPPATSYYPTHEKPTETPKSRRQKRREVVSMVARSVSNRVTRRRAMSVIFPEGPKNAELDDDMFEQQSPPPLPQRAHSFVQLSPLSRSLNRHSLLLPELRRKGNMPETQPAQVPELDRPLTQRGADGDDAEPYIVSEDADWTDMEAFMDPDALEMLHGDAPGWEQYAELGGLTDMR